MILRECFFFLVVKIKLLTWRDYLRNKNNTKKEIQEILRSLRHHLPLTFKLILKIIIIDSIRFKCSNEKCVYRYTPRAILLMTRDRRLHIRSFWFNLQIQINKQKTEAFIFQMFFFNFLILKFKNRMTTIQNVEFGIHKIILSLNFGIFNFYVYFQRHIHSDRF